MIAGKVDVLHQRIRSFTGVNNQGKQELPRKQEELDMSNIIDSGSTLRNMGLADNKKTQASSSSKSGAESSTAPVSADSDDKVQLSATPEKITQIRETIDATPEVDSARVADIKAKIAAGEYPVNPEQIAEKMIDLEKLLS